MNILVTGANGQLGTELRILSLQFPQTNFTFTDIAELDITDIEAIRNMVASQETDLLINCAAFTAVDKAESNTALAHKLNAEAPGLLAQAMKERKGEIIHISTDYVFNGRASVPYTEEMEPCPQSVYGSTKLEGEQQVATHNPHSIILRTAWLYSPYGNNFVKTMLRLGRERSTLDVVFDQVGTPTYASDLAQAIMTIATCPNKVYGTFHFSNEGVASWYDFTKAIHRLAGITTCQVSPIHTKDYPTPAQRPAYSVLDKSKIKQAYGITIPYWEDSLKRCLQQLS